MKFSRVIFSFIFFTILSQSLTAAVYKSGFVAKNITNKLNSPTSMDIAPDGRIFVTEKSGNVRLIVNNVLQEEPILTVEVDEYVERGLGSIVLHPQFDVNGYFYIYYNVQFKNQNVIKRFKMNGNSVIPNSDTLIFEFPTLTGAIHNGGAMKFDSLGYLYVATGEGGDHSKAQNLNTILGKMLRINDDGSIPTDNPFYNQLTGVNRAIYAYGLRNPFSFDIDRISQRIFVNDVGEATWEEINEILPGKNFGWSKVEGNIGIGAEVPENYQDPFFTYNHTVGCAVVGGVFYNPKKTNWPIEYMNKYIFSDFCSGMVSVLDLQTKTISDSLIKWANSPTNFKVGLNGELYVLEFYSGNLWSVNYVGSGAPFISAQSSDKNIVVNEEVKIELEVVGDNPLTYNWFLNDQAVLDNNFNTLTLTDNNFDLDSAYVYCEISNNKGFVVSDTIYIYVNNNTRPLTTIKYPIIDQKYNAGDTLFFSGYATDHEDGDLPTNKLAWKIDFHHDSHTHPVLNWTSNLDTGFVFLPRVGELSTNVFYRVYLRAIDSDGFTSSSYRDVYPNLVKVDIVSNFSNAKIYLDGTLYNLPYTLNGVVGTTRVLSSNKYMVFGDSLVEFLNFDDQVLDSLKSFNLPDTDSDIEINFNFVEDWTIGDGTGLYARYRNGVFVDGKSNYEKVDPQINFFWDWAGPSGLNSDDFSVAWTGQILAPVTGEYEFFYIFNDFGIITLDGIIYTNSWGNEGSNSGSFKVELIGGELYPLKVVMGEKKWQSQALFSWKIPYVNKKEAVPSNFLFPLDVIDTIEQLSLENLKIYPTISSSLVFSNKPNSIKSYTIYNLKGDKILEKNNIENLVAIDIGFLKEGTYILQVSNNESIYTTRIVKVND